jgi:aldehyde dehydrogenase (NAD+)
MQQEIFGPVLPVLRVPDVDAAIARVNAGDKPLALYAFSSSDATLAHVVEQTSSGGVCLNHVLMHLTAPTLPFGGVGESGTGAYHGRSTIDAFSHRKAVMAKPVRPDVPIMYPPFGKVKSFVLRKAFGG